MQRVSFLILALTGQCNLACRYCYAAEEVPVQMPIERILTYLDTYLAPGGTVQLTGGEPLLAWDGVEAVLAHHARDPKAYRIQLQTNATAMTAKRAEQIARAGVAVGISMDGVPSIQDQLRPYKMGERSAAVDTVEGIRLLGEAGVSVGLTCVLTKQSIVGLEDFITFAHYLGHVRQIGWNILRPQGRGNIADAVTAEQLQQYLPRALAHNDKLGAMTGRPIRLTAIEKIKAYAKGAKPFSHCYAWHETGLYIGPTGKQQACASWAADPAEVSIRDTLQPFLAECESCKDLPLCGGGCYSRCGCDATQREIECLYKRLCIAHYRASCVEEDIRDERN